MQGWYCRTQQRSGRWRKEDSETAVIEASMHFACLDEVGDVTMGGTKERV